MKSNAPRRVTSFCVKAHGKTTSTTFFVLRQPPSCTVRQAARCAFSLTLLLPAKLDEAICSLLAAKREFDSKNVALTLVAHAHVVLLALWQLSVGMLCKLQLWVIFFFIPTFPLTCCFIPYISVCMCVCVLVFVHVFVYMSSCKPHGTIWHFLFALISLCWYVGDSLMKCAYTPTQQRRPSNELCAPLSKYLYMRAY